MCYKCTFPHDVQQHLLWFGYSTWPFGDFVKISTNCPAHSHVVTHSVYAVTSGTYESPYWYMWMTHMDETCEPTFDFGIYVMRANGQAANTKFAAYPLFTVDIGFL